jgi:3-phosphoglycerate kinase
MLAGTITPTAIRVLEKVEKAADQVILKGQLSTELLAANNAKEEERKARNNAPNKVVQKYREIYSYVARKQIKKDKREEQKVVNIREKRL